VADLGRVGIELRRVNVNGQPGAECLDPDGRLIGGLTLDIATGQIQAIRSIVNPEKLGHLGQVGDANALIARMRESDNQTVAAPIHLAATSHLVRDSSRARDHVDEVSRCLVVQHSGPSSQQGS
jgi:hypothetical protein